MRYPLKLLVDDDCAVFVTIAVQLVLISITKFVFLIALSVLGTIISPTKDSLPSEKLNYKGRTSK